MHSKSQTGSFIDSLTTIQSIFDTALNRVLLLRLRFPSSAPVWSELAELAECLCSARGNVGMVLQVLIGKRENGVEVAGDPRQLKPLYDVIEYLHVSLLGPIERGPRDEGLDVQSAVFRDTPVSSPAKPPDDFTRSLDTPRTPRSFTLERKSSVKNTTTLMQVAADGQRRTLAAIVKILEQPQNLPAEERRSLADSLNHQSFLSISTNTTSTVDTGARNSIFAKPGEQLEARLAEGRPQRVRSSSLGMNSPISPLQVVDPVLRASREEGLGLGAVAISGSETIIPLAPSQTAPQIQFRNPFEQKPEPQRASTLAPIPITELEVDPAYLLKSKALPPPPPTFDSLSPGRKSIARRSRPVGLPFLSEDAGPPKSISSPAKQHISIVSSPVELPADPDPAAAPFLSSPLSASPFPVIAELPAEVPNCLPAQPIPFSQFISQQKDLQPRPPFLSREQSLPQFSPFSEPSLESSDSYFVESNDETLTIQDSRPPSKSIGAGNIPVKHPTVPIVRDEIEPAKPPLLQRRPASKKARPFPPPPTRPPPILSSSSNSSPNLPSSTFRSQFTPPPFVPSPPRSPRKEPSPAPRVSGLARSSTDVDRGQPPSVPGSSNDQIPPRLTSVLKLAPRSSTESAASKTQPSRSLTEFGSSFLGSPVPSTSASSLRPSTADSSAPRSQLVVVPPMNADAIARISPRNLRLSIASPVDEEAEEALVQPSAWNEYLGFCVGAALSQMDKPGAMIATRTVQADLRGHTVLNFLKCSNTKCAFQGHGPADKIWESNGVQFRRNFLVRSHCKQKKARNSIYTYQCIFCVLQRQSTPCFQGQDSFLQHVSTHRDQPISQAILKRAKCIANRRAEVFEDFDINLIPTPSSQPGVARIQSSLAPDSPAVRSHCAPMA